MLTLSVGLGLRSLSYRCAGHVLPCIFGVATRRTTALCRRYRREVPVSDSWTSTGERIEVKVLTPAHRIIHSRGGLAAGPATFLLGRNRTQVRLSGDPAPSPRAQLQGCRSRFRGRRGDKDVRSQDAGGSGVFPRTGFLGGDPGNIAQHLARMCKEGTAGSNQRRPASDDAFRGSLMGDPAVEPVSDETGRRHPSSN